MFTRKTILRVAGASLAAILLLAAQPVRAQSDAQTIALAFALLPVICVILTELKVVGKSAAAVFVAQAQITKELQLSDRRKQFPFFAAV